MSYKLTHDAVHAPNCKGSTKLVLIALADFANEKTGLCYPAHATIAHTIGCSRRAVVSAITDLEKLGYIRRGPKHGLSLSYSFAIPSTCEKSSHNREGALCEKSAHNGDGATCEKSSHNHPCEPVKNLHRGCEESSQGDVKNFHTNREDRIENNNRESTKQASIVDSGVEGGTGGTNTPKESQAKEESATSQAKPSCFARLDDKQSFSLNDLKDEMLVELKGKGLTANVADAKVQAVWPEFKARANELKSKGKLPADNQRRRGYLYKILSDKVNKGPNQVQAQAEEPKSLEEIFKLLLEETKNQNPEIAEHLTQLSVKDLPNGTFNKLTKKEEEDWSTVKGSRINYVRSTIEGWMYGRISQARHDEEEELYSSLSHNRNKLAQLKTMPDGYYHPTISYDEAVKNTEARIAKIKAALAKLKAKAKK